MLKIFNNQYGADDNQSEQLLPLRMDSLKRSRQGTEDRPWSDPRGFSEVTAPALGGRAERGVWELRAGCGWWSSHQAWAKPNKAPRQHGGGAGGHRSPMTSCFYLELFSEFKALSSCLAD